MPITPQGFISNDGPGQYLKVPQLTTVERNALINPSNGTIVYDFTDLLYWVQIYPEGHS
jgi:hypothetical protein